MNILIIGNGFDLAHKLPTTYTDFLKFFHNLQIIPTFTGTPTDYNQQLLKDYPHNCVLKNTLNKIFDDMNHSVSTIPLKKKFSDMTAQEIYDNLNGNIWYAYLYRLYEEGLMKGINWIDFESEISHIIEIFDRTEENLYLELDKNSVACTFSTDEKIDIFLELFDEYKFSSDKNPFTYRDFLNKSYHQLRCLIYCIELYLNNYVENQPISIFSADIETTNPQAVLCFNYTHTFTKQYSSCLPKATIHYIHGEAKISDTIDTSNMVLGIDEYYKGEDCNIHTNYNIYKKFTQRVINETGFDYRNWIQNMEHDSGMFSKINPLPNNIFVFGHSLDVTDKDILKDFIDRNDVKVTVFYYDKQQQTQQIANLVKMLGQNRFIEMINSIPQQLSFVKQQDMKPST